MVRIHLLGTMGIFCLGFSCSNVLASTASYKIIEGNTSSIEMADLNQVTYPERPYISNNNNYLVPEASFTLTCHCSTPGVDKYTWYFKQGVRKRSAKVTELFGQNGKNYYVKEADWSNEGLYVCKAWINGKTTRGSQTFLVLFYGLTVSPIPEIDVLEVPSIDYFNDGWVSVTLSCEIPSNYPSTYVFKKDYDQVQRSNSKTYTIYDPQPEDSGTYTCAVTSTETGSIAFSDETYTLKVSSG